MNYKNKIIKYNFKINKITDKINKLLVEKKIENIKIIHKSINQLGFIQEILNEILNNNKIDNSNGENIYIIITGIFGCGKTTLINNFKLFFGSDIINLIFSANEERDMDIIIEKNKNLQKKSLILVELKLDLLNILQYKNINYHVINIVPKNIKLYKSKLINKFFIDKNNLSAYYYNINNIIGHNSINNNISLLLNSDQIFLSDNDFNFLNKIIVELIKYAEEFNIERYNLKNITKYYF